MIMPAMTEQARPGRMRLPLLMAGLFTVVAAMAAAGSLWPPVALVSIVFLVVVIGLKYPMTVGMALIVVAVFLPDYIGVWLQGFGMVVNGRLLVSLLLLFVGLVATRDGRPPHVRHVQWTVALLALAWVGVTFAAMPGGLAERTQMTTSASLADVSALLGGLLLACAPGGRRRLIIALVVAGSVAAAAALAEFVLQHNALLDLGLRYELRADAWRELPVRFGLIRSSGAFGHPIRLGVVLGLCLMAALEAAHVRALPIWLSMAAVTSCSLASSPRSAAVR